MRFLKRSNPGNLRKRLGSRGERHAAKWLRKQGYRILHRNFTLGDDEADLIALDPDGKTIVIIEVKTRSDDRIPPEEAINHTKRFRMARLASRLAKTRDYQGRSMRLDVIAIHWPEGGDPDLRHYSNAFESPI
ncbi:MAG: YraN family protein [Planctomycetes bacterium]|nr:YraN family protein [Planctomycetota bacterium]